jgi:hypothetical protein
MRVLPPTDDATALLAAFIPYGLIGYMLAFLCMLVALARARHRLIPAVITAAVAVLSAYHLAWLAPLFVDDQRSAAAEQFQLMSLNMHGGEADSIDVAERAAHADVVILVEATPMLLLPWNDTAGTSASRIRWAIRGTVSPTPLSIHASR